MDGGLRILPAVEAQEREDTPALVRIARALERIADRFDSDSQVFSEMVEQGKGLSA